MERRQANEDDYNNIVNAIYETWRTDPQQAEGFLRCLLEQAVQSACQPGEGGPHQPGNGTTDSNQRPQSKTE
jgi:hypothetical protein